MKRRITRLLQVSGYLEQQNQFVFILIMKEYIINSIKYGKQIVLLDNEDYNRIISEGIKPELRYDKTINGFYVQFKIKPYGVSKISGKDVRSTKPLHRWIINCSEGMQVDHINRNSLDNRKENLRIVTSRENNMNRRNNAKIPGVRWHSQGKKWNARITIKGKEKSLGMFNNYDEAVSARLKALEEVNAYAL